MSLNIGELSEELHHYYMKYRNMKVKETDIDHRNKYKRKHVFEITFYNEQD